MNDTWDWPVELVQQRFPLSILSSSQPPAINFRFGALRIDPTTTTSSSEHTTTPSKASVRNTPITAFFARVGTKQSPAADSEALWNNTNTVVTSRRLFSQDVPPPPPKHSNTMTAIGMFELDDVADSAPVPPLKSFAEMLGSAATVVAVPHTPVPSGVATTNGFTLEDDDDDAYEAPDRPSDAVVKTAAPLPQERTDSESTQPPYEGALTRGDVEMCNTLEAMKDDAGTETAQPAVDTTVAETEAVRSDENTVAEAQPVVVVAPATVSTPPPSPFLRLTDDDDDEEQALVVRRRRRIRTVAESDDEHLKEVVDTRPAAEKRRERKKTLDKRAAKEMRRRAVVDIATAVRPLKRHSDDDDDEKHLPLPNGGVEEYASDDSWMEKDDEYRNKIERKRRYALKNGIDPVANAAAEAAADKAMVHRGVVDSDEERERFKAEYGADALVDDEDDDAGESVDDSGETSCSDIHSDDSATTRSHKQRAALAKSIREAAEAEAAAQAEAAATAQSLELARTAAITAAHRDARVPIDNIADMVNDVVTHVRAALDELAAHPRPAPALFEHVRTHIAKHCKSLTDLVAHATELAMPIVEMLNSTDPALGTVLRSMFLDPTSTEIQYGQCDRFSEHARDFKKKPVCTLCCNLVDIPSAQNPDTLTGFRVVTRFAPFNQRIASTIGCSILCNYARLYIESMTNFRRLDIVLCSAALGYFAKTVRDKPDEPVPSALPADAVQLLAHFIETNWTMLNGIHASLIGIDSAK